MGVGAAALAASLAPEGWSLTPEALERFGQRSDVRAARAALLDADLAAPGIALPSPSLHSQDVVRGPTVLQLVDAADISRPRSDPRGASDAPPPDASPRRMLRLRLTDGATPNAAIVVGVEHAPCPSLPDAAAMPPGSKLAVAPNARVQRRDGVLLFRPGDLAFLGGRVPRLIEAHEMARLAAQVADAEPRAVDDFPPFRAFRPERDAGFAERARTDAERPDPNAADGVVSEGSSRPEGSTGRPEGSTGRPEGSGGPEGSHAATGGLVPRRRPALPPTRAQPCDL